MTTKNLSRSFLALTLAASFSLYATPRAICADATKAVAVLTPAKDSKVQGKVTFTKEGDGVRVVAEITGLTPGKHGFHIHEFGDITGVDGMTTGGHFNPHKTPHGAPEAGEKERHAGDFGNIEADAQGNAKLDLVVKDLHLEGDHGILGHAIVVHAKADDLKTQPSGDAGGRIGFGVIGVAKP